MTDLGFKVYGVLFSEGDLFIIPRKNESQERFIKRISELDMFESVDITASNKTHDYTCPPCVIEGIAKNPHVKRIHLDIYGMKSHAVLTPLFRDRTFDEIMIIDHTDYRIASSYQFISQMLSSNYGPRHINLSRMSVRTEDATLMLFESLMHNTRVQKYIGPIIDCDYAHSLKVLLDTNTTLTDISINAFFDVNGHDEIFQNATQLKCLSILPGYGELAFKHVQNIPPNLECFLNAPMKLDNMESLNAFLGYIDKNKALVELDLSSSMWKSDTYVAFMKAMETNTTIQKLTTNIFRSNDEIESVMPAAIAGVLANNNTLLHLSARPSSPAYEYKFAIANIHKSLKDNYTLQELKLLCHDFNMPHHKVLKRNQSLFSFILKHCKRLQFLDYLPRILKPPTERKHTLISRPIRFCAKYNRIN